eukprot:TRINITY_DN26504_c0_g1_i1.p1 TRINITY_DN26504_c0_g1~~TRINITY_DN26504_c0_g1_i1.p1  ORF type:complete len:482 (-),score=110.14 TRINITY_DN26504_c0_g1_i1:150-1595(-)
MPPRSKVTRAEEDAVRRRWAALTREQRLAATRFEDAGLISCIREGVQTLYVDQCRMLRMGLRSSSKGQPDLNVDSSVLRDVLDLPWRLERSGDYPDAFTMDLEDQQSLMTLRDSMLDGELLFVHLRGVLPDLLSAHSGRTPVHRARWKQLWKAPSSATAMDRQLAQLVEQALWSMASSAPAAAAAAAESAAAAAAAEEATAAVVEDEDWMFDDSDCKVAASSSSSRPSGRSPKQSRAAKPSKAERRAKAAARLAAEAAEEAEAAAAAEAAEAADAEEECLEVEEVGADATTISAEPEGSRSVGGAWADAPTRQRHSRSAPKAESTSVEELPSQVAASNAASSESAESDASGTNGARDALFNEDVSGTSERKQAVLEHHFWSARDRRLPVLGWCLPALPWSRGYWAPIPEGQRYPDVSVVVRNTFLDIDDFSDAAFSASARLSRSLSPRPTKGRRAALSGTSDGDGDSWEDADGWSGNYWHQ